MFSEILKIIPKIDNKDLDKMTKNLQSRFAKVAKGFGKGIGNMLKGGGAVGLAIGLLDKILNPLQAIQESMEKTLTMADDVVTNAKQFETSTGNLAKLVKAGEATGLSQDNLFLLLSKFQGAVATARANPNDESVSAVRGFTDNKDTGAAFFDFMVSLQKVSKDQQRLIQEQIFGEKQVLKMADFLQSDFPALFKRIGLDKVSSNKLGKAYEKLGDLNDKKDEMAAATSVRDVFGKAAVINGSMISAKDASDRAALDRENRQIQSYTDLMKISETSAQIMGIITEGAAQLGKFISWITPTLTSIATNIEKFMKGPVSRGLIKWFGGGKGE